MSTPLDIECHKRELIYWQAAYQEDINRKIVLKRIEEDYKNIMTKEDSELFDYYLKVNEVKSKILIIPVGIAFILLRKKFINYPKFQQYFIFGSIGLIPWFYNQFWYPSRKFNELSEFYYFKYFEKASQMPVQQDENKNT